MNGPFIFRLNKFMAEVEISHKLSNFFLIIEVLLSLSCMVLNFHFMFRYFLSWLPVWLLCWQAVQAQSAMFTKVVTAGGKGMEESRSIIADPAGNLYITGRYDSTCYFGHDSVPFSASENMFLAKYNPSSGFIWSVAPIASQRAQGEALAFDDQGSVYVTGSFYGNIDFGNGFAFQAAYFNTFIAKYNGAGNLIWAKQVAGDNNNPKSITGDKEGNIYVAGQFEGDLVYDTITTYSFRSACFLLKIGRNGEAKWISRSGGTGTSYPQSVSVDSSGNVILAGTFINQVSFGTINLSGFGSYDIFIARLNTSGDVIWAVQAGGGGDDRGSSVVCGNDGAIFINGSYENIAHFGPFTLNTGGGYYSFATYAAKLNANGSFVWANSLDVSCRSNNLMCIDAKNNIYLTSSFRGSAEVGPSVLWSHGYGDVYVIKMDQDGQVLSAKGAGSTWVDEGMGIALLPSGDIAVTGVLSNNAVFDSIAVTTPNSIFIAMVAQHGPIAIDEINYQSSDTLDTGDWVEIRNTGSKTINLTGWTLKDGNDNNEYVVGSPTTIGPGQFLVFCQDTIKFKRFHPDLSNVAGPFNFELASNGEKVRLYDAGGLLMAQVRYYAVPPWPGMADGTGRTIELRDDRGELSDGNNWFTGCLGGSPGKPYQDCDSLGITTNSPLIPSLCIFPDPVSDLLNARFYSPECTKMQLCIHNSTGKIVKSAYYTDIKQGNNTIELSVRDIPAGVYLAILTAGRHRVTGKFMIVKRG